MIDITNKLRTTSIKDLSKPPKPDSLVFKQSEISFYCGLFTQISNHSEKMSQSWKLPFTSTTDPLFLTRCKQIQWMFSARCLLQLNQDTIFHAVAYLDKYIALKNPAVSKLKLISVSCLAMASKVNEIYPAYFSNIIDIFKFPFRCEDYAEMESQILHTFQFKLPQVTVYELFYMYLTKHRLPSSILKKESIISILQNILLDYQLMTYDQKYCAIAAAGIAAKMKRANICIPHQLLQASEYKCAFQRLNEVIIQLRARFSSKHKINNPQNSNKNIQL